MSELDTLGTVFRPVKCTETSMETAEPVEGFVYFATDSGRIYLGSNGSYLPMGGGNSGVFYATKNIDETTIDKPIFSMDDIEGEDMPAIDDLIINVGLNVDYNGFYRVSEIISETEVIAYYLPVGGGGSAGGGGGTASGSAVITYVSPTLNQIQSGITILTGSDYSITYQFDAKDASGENIIVPGTGTWIVNGEEIAQEQILVGRHTYTIPSKYFDSNRDYNTIKLSISIDTGGNIPSKATKTWQIRVINFKLDWNFTYGENSYIKTDTFSLSFTPYGSIDCTAHIIFDNSYEPEVTYFTRNIKASETNKLVYTDLIPSFPYGAHSCEIYLTAEINGQLQTSNSIRNEITFILDGTTSILTVPYYQDRANQYETLNIPFLAYDPDSENVKVNFYADGVLIDTVECDRTLQYWPYSITNYGNIVLTLATANNEARKDIELSVSKLNLDISEVSGYAFKLKATDFSGNEGLRNWNSNGVTLSFSDNFDWINGGLKFEQKPNGVIDKYICVRQGTRMTINYELFNRGNPSNAGKVFKFCFKATNCYDYEAPVLECYEAESKLGLKYDAQKAIFSTNVSENFNTQYYENSYIELEAEIWPDVADIDENRLGDRFLMFWVDGIPVKVEPYIRGTNFENIRNFPKIVIGSDLCDVYVYTAKVYERRLTEDEHITNFIMDAPNGTELLERYNRNDILGSNGDISYERLIRQNPGCRAYLYEVPHVTQNKNDKVKGCSYIEYYQNSDAPIRTATDVITRVQGTSSSAYGVAAFNLRSDFGDGVILDENGNQISGWGVSDTAIPIDYFCTKVNVASSENANNVVNQEWYNKFQPYWDGHRRKTREDGKLYRDCMEFNSGVVFIKDLNPKDDYYKDGKPNTGAYIESNAFLDTPGYVANPYYKQYAIGNMGNDKKNDEVFHDTDNPNACCVEVTDNQTSEQFMTVRVDNATVWNDDDDIPFEFRYPDGNEDATPEMKQAFVDFVNWMADSNPKAHTNEPLSTVQHFEPYTFKGFDPPGYEGKSSPTGISLKGVTISRYAGDYSTDSYEYRMAKMLSECEDHLVMDSVVFHYLFIQRHTMVDNVAKNTFWSTEDLKHWDLTKDYDNDTSDGNNNSGFLTFSYGLECLDRTEDGLSIFNAPDSVWINFIFGLPEAQQDLYQKLSVRGAWDPDAYLNEFKKHQELIPERCWVYDYFRKYIRPRRLGLDTGTYLERLEGGKKTHQREQFERYQDFYINSKYIAGNDNTPGAALDLRLNMTSENWSVDNVIPIQYYVDCYSQSLIGGVNFSSPERIKRGTIFNIPIGEKLTNVNDSTCYIYGARMIQVLNGLPQLYPTYISIDKAVKLRSLTVGSNDEGYENKSLGGLDISQNVMLQEAFIQNCTNPGLGALDLSKLYQIKDLELNGSAFSGLVMADGAITEILYINPVNTLEIANLSKLNDLRLDDGIYNSLSELSVINCPAIDPYSYALVLNGKILIYHFNDFTWESTSGTDFVCTTDTLNKVKTIQSITALDNLIKVRPLTNSTAASLIGTLNINLTTDSDGYNYGVDEFDIYKKYCKIYPNLVINYGDGFGSNLIKAITIIFKASENSTADHYRVLSDGETPLSQLITADGPLGVTMVDPFVESTEQYDFVFTHYWESEGQLYYDDTIASEDAKPGSISLMTYVPTTDMVFIPKFEEKTRFYNVRFFDGTDIIPQGDVDSWPVEYGHTYNGPMIDYYYKEHPADEYRYEFRGWSDSPVINNNPVLIDSIQNYVVTGNTNIYAYYEEVNNTQTATDYKYFNIVGNEISLKDEYKNVFRGKITLPSKTSDGRIPLKKIAERAFYPGDGASLITHVFFLDDAEYTTVGRQAFSATAGQLRLGAQSLRAVYLPSTITTIENSAFQYQIDLTIIGNISNVLSIGDYAFTTDINFYQDVYKMKVEINELPPNIQSIGSNAFMNCGNEVRITKLPSTLISIGSNAFANSKGVKPYEFGSNNEDKEYLSILVSGVFQNSGVGSINDGTIEFFSSIGSRIASDGLLPEGIIAQSVFANTGVKKIIFHNSDLYNAAQSNIIVGGNEMTYLQYWGFSSDVEIQEVIG